MIGAARQEHPPLSQVVASIAQSPEPQTISSKAPVSTSAAQLSTAHVRTPQQSTEPAAVSPDAGQDPLSKRRRIVGTGLISSETPALPSVSFKQGLVTPQGAENCLTGCIFVFTEELPTLSRSRVTQLSKQHGGQVTLNSDKTTTHAVLGHGVSRNKLTILDRLKTIPYCYHTGKVWAHQIIFLGEANDRLFEASKILVYCW